MPLLACLEGVNKVKKDFPSFQVCPVETIEKDNNFFGQYSEYEDLKELYLKIEKNKLNSSFLKGFSCGYNALALTISYSHGTPNATLPLYWYESKDFFPLVRR